MRFTRQQHLRRSSDFERLRTSGKRRECGFFYLNFSALPDRQPPVRRLGVIASRRVGPAIARNRAKRLLRETFRLNQDCLPPSCDVVLIARQSILNARFEELQIRFRTAMDSLASRK